MTDHTVHGKHHTYVTITQPWGLYITARVMCSDGKLRMVKRIATTPDTFFSVPASVRVRGRTVSGYVTTDDDTWWFRRYDYGKNAHLLPKGKGDVTLSEDATV